MATERSIKLPRNFKYCYLVNTSPENGQDVGTFTIVPKIQGTFSQTYGDDMDGYVQYYTDDQVNDDPANRAMHFERVMAVKDGRKSGRDLGILVGKQDTVQPMDQLRQIVDQMGGSSIDVDRVGLATEILAASKMGFDIESIKGLLK
jgi:hypothetical protein